MSCFTGLFSWSILRQSWYSVQRLCGRMCKHASSCIPSALAAAMTVVCCSLTPPSTGRPASCPQEEQRPNKQTSPRYSIQTHGLPNVGKEIPHLCLILKHEQMISVKSMPGKLSVVTARSYLWDFWNCSHIKSQSVPLWAIYIINPQQLPCRFYVLCSLLCPTDGGERLCGDIIPISA